VCVYLFIIKEKKNLRRDNFRLQVLFLILQHQCILAILRLNLNPLHFQLTVVINNHLRAVVQGVKIAGEAGFTILLSLITRQADFNAAGLWLTDSLI
jgi:hypothetical protein